MSDTDDTDALLSCDPEGGLQTLLGLTMDDEDSSQVKGLSPEKKDSLKKSKRSIKKEEESSLDVSDFFNSDGELVLSGLSQFSETSVSTTDGNLSQLLEANDNLKKDANGNDAKQSESSVVSLDEDDGTDTLCTAVEKKSDGVQNVGGVPPSVKTSSSNSSENGGTGNTVKAPKVRNDLNRKPLEIEKVDKRKVPQEVQDDLKRQLVAANNTNPDIQDWIEGNSNKISYGVLNLDLNDLKSFAEGLSRCDFFPKREKVSTFVPTRNEKGEQVFSKAPNFRTPGGYKPPKNPPKCRELTDEQIREEVRKMYQFPDADDEEEFGSDTLKVKTNSNLNRESEEKVKENKTESESNKSQPLSNEQNNDEENAKIKFNFLSNSSISNEFEFGKGKGKPVKRKLLPNDGQLCGGTVGSIPDLGFGLRNVLSNEPKEPVMERTRTWVTSMRQNIPTTPITEGAPSDKVINDTNNSTNAVTTTSSTIENKKSSFSFGYGEAEDSLSPIKPTTKLERVTVETDDRRMNPILSNVVNIPSPAISETDLPQNTELNMYSSTLALASSNSGSETSSQKENDEGAIQASMALPIPTPSSFQKPKLPYRRVIKKAGSKFKGMASSMASPRNVDILTSHFGSGDGASIQSDDTPSMALDLEKILSEIELPGEEIESLIENLDDDDMDLAKAQFFDAVNNDDDENLVDALSDLKLDAWRTSDNETAAEKFHSEVFKREQCEKELRIIQENFLTEKQKNAVLEGTLKRKNLMLVQITMAFNRVCKEWTKFDRENKVAVVNLQKNQKLLAHAYKRSKDRITQYEKELHKTLEMADSFKTKLVDLQRERDSSVTLLKNENSDLEGQIQKLKESLESLKNERDATLRALRESQIKLDEGKQTIEAMEVAIKTLESKNSEHAQKYDELLEAKSFQETNYLEIVERRNELEALLMNLTAELNEEKSSKDKLKRDLQEEVERKNQIEAERLHEYYNKKVQEILKSATEEAAHAEAALKEQMKRASLESERKLSECKERFQKELEIARSRYEAEIEKLKRENLHRQLLISSTVKQLQMGESHNLDVNSLTSVQPRMPSVSLHKDILDSLKAANSNGNAGESSYKNSSNCALGNMSKLSKFTLDHLPSTLSAHNKLQGSKSNYSAFHDYVPFEATGNLGRFKTSTPIESSSSATNQNFPVSTPLEYDGPAEEEYRNVRNNTLPFVHDEPSNISNTDKKLPSGPKRSSISTSR